jgi:3'(2'), 5'-bisphosphate nucleotidase
MRYHRRMDDRTLLALAVRLAGLAGAEILAVRDAGFTVRKKTDHSPVTLADTRAETVIVEGLRAATPDIPVIAEEEVAAGKITEPGAQYWLVDPLDGTREFAAGRPSFAVNVGLVRNGKAVLGAVGAPATGEIYAGIVGVGAWKTVGGETWPIAARKAGAKIDVMASHHYADDPKLAALLASYSIGSVTNIGSALKFCRLAEGLADFYPRLGTTMEWDTAAPQAVLEAAGGCVLTMDDQPLAYGKPGFKNPNFICYGLR